MRTRRQDPEIDDVGNLLALQPSHNNIKSSITGSRAAHVPKEAASEAHRWPPFEPKCGYCTNQARELYIRLVHYKRPRRRTENGINDSDNSDCTTPSESLIANPDIQKPLYFWQLYSILGRQPIIDIIKDFYISIYHNPAGIYQNEEADRWFRNAFTSNCMITKSSGGAECCVEEAINTHASYWIDVFGGGDVFHGGECRLSFTHKYHATSQVMNEKGASIWMKHMMYAIHKNVDDLPEDPRIVPCILDFLKTKMKEFSEEYGWVFDERDFEFLRR